MLEDQLQSLNIFQNIRISKSTTNICNKFFNESSKKRSIRKRVVEDLLDIDPNICKSVVTLAGPNVKETLKIFRHKILSFESSKQIYKIQVPFALKYKRFMPIHGDIFDYNLSIVSKLYKATLLDLDLMCAMSNDSIIEKMLHILRELPDHIGVILTSANRGVRTEDAISRQEHILIRSGIRNIIHIRYGKFMLLSYGIIGK